MKKTILFISFILFVVQVSAQQRNRHKKSFGRTHFEGGLTVSSDGSNHMISPSGVQYWGVGKKKQKFKFGIGARYTASIGDQSLEYITARAQLTSGQTGPGVFFSDQIPENIDTMSLNNTRIHLINVLLALRYDMDRRFGLEFNIDLAGLSFGARKTATLTYDDGKTHTSGAYPTTGNLLLVSDNDLGSLNSEFMISYLHKNRMRFKIGPVFMFNEYELVSPVNYVNDAGTFVDAKRYRNKSLQLGVGFNYVFKYYRSKQNN